MCVTALIIRLQRLQVRQPWDPSNHVGRFPTTCVKPNDVLNYSHQRHEPLQSHSKSCCLVILLGFIWVCHQGVFINQIHNWFQNTPSRTLFYFLMLLNYLQLKFYISYNTSAITTIDISTGVSSMIISTSLKSFLLFYCVFINDPFFRFNVNTIDISRTLQTIVSLS